jgi:hypothetical protein
MRSKRSSAGSPIPRVRKRVSVGHSQIPTDASGRWDPDNSKGAKATVGAKVRNCFISIAVVSFPIGIFMLPLLIRASSYPRVVVTLSTTPDRLPHIQPTLESLLYQQSYVADTVYLVLPQQDYDSKQPLKYEPWPDFLQAMIPTTNLEILQPTFDYGPVSNVLHALDKERTGLNQQSKETSDTTEPATTTKTQATRIVYLSDDIRYHPRVVRQLVDASLEADGDVVALSGGLLRDKFRQLKHSNLNYDKQPNMYMHAIGKRRSEWKQVDIVQGFTAVCIPATMDTQVLRKAFSQESSVSARVVKSGDVLLSAAMQVQNMTRWVVPGGGTPHYANSTKSQQPPSKDMLYKDFMEAVRYVQREFHVWQNYTFLDLKELTKEQLDAIDCEATYEQDCSGEICWPNPTKCPEARAILEELTWKGDGETRKK